MCAVHVALPPRPGQGASVLCGAVRQDSDSGRLARVCVCANGRTFVLGPAKEEHQRPQLLVPVYRDSLPREECGRGDVVRRGKGKYLDHTGAQQSRRRSVARVVPCLNSGAASASAAAALPHHRQASLGACAATHPPGAVVVPDLEIFAWLEVISFPERRRPHDAACALLPPRSAIRETTVDFPHLPASGLKQSLAFEQSGG